jgi:hypothetical protein
MPKIIEKGTPMSQVMIVVEFEVKPEHRSQFIELMRGHAQRSRRDDGCLQFDLMLPKDDDKHVFLVEKWRCVCTARTRWGPARARLSASTTPKSMAIGSACRRSKLPSCARLVPFNFNLLVDGTQDNP